VTGDPRPSPRRPPMLRDLAAGFVFGPFAEVLQLVAGAAPAGDQSAGPSRLITAGPEPARTTISWLSSSDGFTSRWMAPGGT